MANINVFIPPGSTSSYAAPVMDSHQNVAQRLSNPNTINKRITEARLQDDMRKKLKDEFDKIDLNQDGFVTKEELHDFFEREKVSLVSKLTEMCAANFEPRKSHEDRRRGLRLDRLQRRRPDCPQ